MNPTGKQIKNVLSRLPNPFYDLDFIRELHIELNIDPTPKGGYLAREKLIKCVKLKWVKERIEGARVSHGIETEDGRRFNIPKVISVYEVVNI